MVECAAKHEARIGVDIVPDAGDLRPVCGEIFHEPLLAKFLRAGHKNDHHLAGGVAFADHDLVDIRQTGGCDRIFKPGCKPIDLLAEKQTIGGGHEIMAVFFVKTELRLAACIICMENALVAIAERLGHGFDRQNFTIELADAL